MSTRRKNERPHLQLRRLLAIIQVLATSPRLLSTREIKRQSEAISGKTVCDRTLSRDLRLLQRLGVVQPEQRGQIDRTRVWRWVGWQNMLTGETI